MKFACFALKKETKDIAPQTKSSLKIISNKSMQFKRQMLEAWKKRVNYRCKGTRCGTTREKPSKKSSSFRMMGAFHFQACATVCGGPRSKKELKKRGKRSRFGEKKFCIAKELTGLELKVSSGAIGVGQKTKNGV